MLTTALSASSPREQVEGFLQAAYVPLPWAWRFHAAARDIDAAQLPAEKGIQPTVACGGARGPGKSHAILAQVGIDDCQRVPGLKVLFLRSLQRAAKESFEDVIARVLVATPHEYSANVLTFPNGSRIVLGGFKDDRDIDKYIGIEYDIIVVEESTLLSETKYQMLEGSLRTSKQGWRPRMYLSTNPGGIGHAWFKKRIVTPHRLKHEGRTRFIPSTYRDNPFLNPEYVDWLEGLAGKLGKAWRDGDWDIFEGQAFPQWNADAHIVDPFPLPDHWAKWRAVDWGYSNPFACLWMTKDPDSGRIFVYREIYGTQLTDRQQARIIRENTPPTEKINVTYADPSMWAAKSAGDRVTDTASEYAVEGVVLTKADNNRVDGKRKVDRLLAPLPDGKPGLQVFSNCYNLIRTLPELVLDKKQVEDVDTTQEDHAYDALRYGQTNQRQHAKDTQPPTHPWAGNRNL